MGNTETVSRIAEHAGMIYKNMKTGADSIINLLPKADDDSLRSHMTGILDGYEKFAADAKKILERENVEPREEGMMGKMGAKMGIGMKTMVDSSPSHIAELLMEGAVMGICETTRTMKSYEQQDGCFDTLQISRDIVSFEEHNLDAAKAFL